jgi:hypothetical protein
MTNRTTWLLALGFSIGAAATTRGEDWPAWRGPRGDGTSNDKSAPVEWSAKKNLLWKVEIPGEGHSSPIVVGDRIFTLTALTDRKDRVLVCLDRKTGKMLWQKTIVTSPLEGKHRLNSFASSTPASDGAMVYCTFLDQRDMVVAAYDMDGTQKWLVRPGVFKSVHGFCSSPVIHKDKLIVNGDHDGAAYIVALDRATGKTIWKTDRENKTRSYCTPIIREFDGRTQMILSGSKCVASYDPDTGKRHWIIDGPTEQFVASLVVNRGLVFVTGGFPDHHLLAIRPNGSGNVTKTHIAWRDTKGVSYVPSPIAAGDYFLVVSDDGIASCLDAATGERQWLERIGKHFSASLVSAGGLVYFLADDGTTTVVRPGPKLDVVATNELGEYCYASPAISDGQLFIRAEKHLFCIGERPARSAALSSAIR